MITSNQYNLICSEKSLVLLNKASPASRSRHAVLFGKEIVKLASVPLFLGGKIASHLIRIPFKADRHYAFYHLTEMAWAPAEALTMFVSHFLRLISSAAATVYPSLGFRGWKAATALETAFYQRKHTYGLRSPVETSKIEATSALDYLGYDYETIKTEFSRFLKFLLIEQNYRRKDIFSENNRQSQYLVQRLYKGATFGSTFTPLDELIFRTTKSNGVETELFKPEDVQILLEDLTPKAKALKTQFRELQNLSSPGSEL
jgi:hypothetical protein